MWEFSAELRLLVGVLPTDGVVGAARAACPVDVVRAHLCPATESPNPRIMSIKFDGCSRTLNVGCSGRL